MLDDVLYQLNNARIDYTIQNNVIRALHIRKDSLISDKQAWDIARSYSEPTFTYTQKHVGIAYSNVKIGEGRVNEFDDFTQFFIDCYEIRRKGFQFIRMYYDSRWSDSQIEIASRILNQCNLKLHLLYWVSYSSDFQNLSIDLSRLGNLPVTHIGIGSENNLHTSNKTAMYVGFNNAVRKAKRERADIVYYHSDAEIGDINNNFRLMPDIDVHGATIYRPHAQSILDMKKQYKSDKPLMITEFGYDSYTLTEDEQLQRNQSALNAFKSLPFVSGITLFQWADVWNKKGTPDIHSDDKEEHFGITKANLTTGIRVKKKSFDNLVV